MKYTEFKTFTKNDQKGYLHNKKVFINMLFKLHMSKQDKTLKSIFKSDPRKCLFIKDFIFDYIDSFDFNYKAKTGMTERCEWDDKPFQKSKAQNRSDIQGWIFQGLIGYDDGNFDYSNDDLQINPNRKPSIHNSNLDNIIDGIITEYLEVKDEKEDEEYIKKYYGNYETYQKYNKVEFN